MPGSKEVSVIILIFLFIRITKLHRVPQRCPNSAWTSRVLYDTSTIIHSNDLLDFLFKKSTFQIYIACLWYPSFLDSCSSPMYQAFSDCVFKCLVTKWKSDWGKDDLYDGPPPHHVCKYVNLNTARVTHEDRLCCPPNKPLLVPRCEHITKTS